MQNFKIPKNTDKVSWTKHSIEKMRFYGLSAQRVIQILRHPERCEKGIVEDCVACMQTIGQKRKTELWVMYIDVIKNNPFRSPTLAQQDKSAFLRNKQDKINQKHRKIITAWRYPGISPVRHKIPIPDDIAKEVENILKNKF